MIDGLPAGDDLDVLLGAEQHDPHLLRTAVEDDGGRVTAHPGPVLPLKRRDRVRQRGMVEGEPGVGDPGGLRGGREEQEPGRSVGAEHTVCDDERNLTVGVEEGRAHGIRGQGPGQAVVECQSEQQRVEMCVHVGPE